MTVENAEAAGNNDDLLTLLDLFVSDTLSNDEETANQILIDLNDVEHFSYRDDWGKAFTRQDVFIGLMRLLQSGRVRVFDDRQEEPENSRLQSEDSIKDLWFQLTDLGRDALSKWIPPSHQSEVPKG